MLAATLLVWVFCGGCGKRASRQENLPEQPIAILHWADKAAKNRATAFEKAGEIPPAPIHKQDPEGAQERAMRAHLNGERSVGLSARLASKPGRLMLYWPRTEKLERVEAAPPGARPLAWSTDHNRLLFVSAHRGGKNQIFEYDLLRKDLRQLTFGPHAHDRADYFRLDSDRNARDDPSGAAAELIVQRSERRGRGGATYKSLHLLAANGTLGPEIAKGIPPGTIRSVLGGGAVVYEQIVVRPRSTGPAVLESWVARREQRSGDEEQLLLRGREPVLTPDGEWIVFASKSSAGYRLRRMRLDGTSRVPIGPGGTEERMPTVSPDGKFVAFIRETPRSRRLSVRSFDGKDTRVILRAGWSEFPVW